MIGNSFFTLVHIAKKIFLEKKLIYLRRPVFYEIICFWEREKSMFWIKNFNFFYRLKLNPENPVSCIPSDPE